MSAKEQQEVNERLDSGENRMNSIETSLHENTALTKELKEEFTGMSADIKEILIIFRAGKSGLKVLGWIGYIIKWVASVAAAAAAIWAVYTGRQPS